MLGNNSISWSVCRFFIPLFSLVIFPWWRCKGFHLHEIFSLIKYFLQLSWVFNISSLGVSVFVYFTSKTSYLWKFVYFYHSLTFILHFSTGKIQWVLSSCNLKFDQQFFPFGLGLQYLFSWLLLILYLKSGNILKISSLLYILFSLLSNLSHIIWVWSSTINESDDKLVNLKIKFVNFTKI